MKNLFYATCLLLAVVFLFGCSSEELNLPQTEAQTACLGHVPVRVQQENLQKIFADPQISESVLGKQTRATVNVNNVQVFDKNGDLLTRAQEESAYYYLFDLDGQGNYALMGANVTVPPLLAIVSKDKDISMEMRNLIAEQEPALANFPEDLSGIAIDGGGGIGEDTETLVKVYDYTNAQFQLLGRRPLTNKWNQWEPFCNMMPSFTDASGRIVPHAAVGCAPLAAALIMCDPIYNAPTFKGMTFNWAKMLLYETMKQEKTDPSFQGVADYDFPKLFKTLTDPANGNFRVSDYGEYITWTYADSCVSQTFRNFGLVNSGKLEDFSESKVLEALQEGYPVFMCDWDTETGGGHAWVCSAALKANVPYTYVPKSQLTQAIPADAKWQTEEKVLLHHNFGWSGNCNGYYYIDMSVNTAMGGILNDNLEPNYRRPSESWGNFPLYKSAEIVINKNK